MRAAAAIGLGLKALQKELELKRVVMVIDGFGWPDVWIVASGPSRREAVFQEAKATI
jgi:hypothetical protein